MKKYQLLFMVATIMLIVASCHNSSIKSNKQSSTQVENADSYYTCSMHLEVRVDKPGNCPKCGMELVEIKSTKSDSTNLHQHTDTMHHTK
jgi:transcription initiation factor IIE alpha subunit